MVCAASRHGELGEFNAVVDDQVAAARHVEAVRGSWRLASRPTSRGSERRWVVRDRAEAETVQAGAKVSVTAAMAFAGSVWPGHVVTWATRT
jgi:hypothetical protein